MIIGQYNGFNVSGTTLTDLLGANNCTLSNSPSVSNGWITFNGADQKAQDDSWAGVANAWTVQIRIKHSDYNQSNKTFLRIRPSTGDANEIRVTYSSSKLASLIVNSTGSSSNRYKDYTANKSLVNNQMYNVTASWDGTNLKIYQDNIEDLPYTKTTDYSPLSQSDATRQLGIGGWSTSYAPVSINEVKIFNTVLGQNVIQDYTIYNAGCL
jgi:hypothetical protein